MDVAFEASSTPPAAGDGCVVTLELTAAETRLLEALPDSGVVIRPVLWCELEDGHDGPHWAIGQLSGDDWWWLRWDLAANRRELVCLALCARTASQGEPGEPGEPCALPAGHVGAHSYTRPA